MNALVSLWPLAAIVVVLAMCVWMLWPDRTPAEPAPYHADLPGRIGLANAYSLGWRDPAKTAGGVAGKSYTGGWADQLYRDQPVHPFTCAYCPIEIPATMATAGAAAVLFREHMATAHPPELDRMTAHTERVLRHLDEPEPDHHALDEYDAIYASEHGDEIVREEHLP